MERRDGAFGGPAARRPVRGWGRAAIALSATFAAIGVGASAVTPASASPARTARLAIRIVGGSSVVDAGHRAFFAASIRLHYCRLELTDNGHVSAGPVQRVASDSLLATWTVPRSAKSGSYDLTLRCAAVARTVDHGATATLPISVPGGVGTLAIIPLRTVRLRASAKRRASERLHLTDALPPGVGDPSAFAVNAPAGVGGGAFSTYWPLGQGVRVQITEGPGGRFSHYTVYTQDAVDLGVPAGTEIRAGFTGVVARVNNGCAVGNRSCGAGYGNYIYLKASDGTCAVMAHLSQINVALGQQIQQYDLIGLSGNTGNSWGAHLHYDHVDCSNNRSLPWAPIEGGPLGEGATVVSQNHPPGAPVAKASNYLGHIVQWEGDRNAQKTAWLVGQDGKRYWIPTIAIYWCLKEQGAPGPDVLSATLLDQLPDTGLQASCSGGKGGATEPLPHTEPPPPPPPPPPPATYSETTGGVTHTWTNYTNAGGSQGSSIPSNATVQIACKIEGFRVEDGDTWWYRVASSPWNGAYYGSADAFYNNGQTSGSLKGTPFVDPAVPKC